MSTRACLVVLGALSLSVTLAAERLPIRTYTTTDGLPHNQINRIVRDSRGFLWFCTADGLSRFDGYRFTTYGDDQGLPHGDVTALIETRDHRYWVGTNGGLARFDPTWPASRRADSSAGSMFTVITAGDAEAVASPIGALVEGGDGTVWVGTSRGLFRVEDTGGRPRLVAIDIGLPREFPAQAIVNGIMADRRGSLWVATPTGLYRRWPDGTHARYTVRDGLPDDFIHDLHEDRNGAMWAATRRAGFFQFAATDAHAAPRVVRTFAVADGLPSVWVFQLFEGGDGTLWAATANGVARLDVSGGRATLRSYGVRQGLSYHEISAIQEDTSGNLWLGTNTVGVMKVARGGITTYDRADGLTIVNAIFEDQSGAVCFRGTTALAPGADDGVDRFGCLVSGRFEWFKPDVFTRDLDLGWVMEHVTLRAHSGEWWLGTGSGIYRFGPTRVFADIKSTAPAGHYGPGDGLASKQTFRLFEDSRGQIWASTISSARNGLAVWNPASNRWRDLTGVDGLPSFSEEFARAFEEDRAGNVWIGFNGGVARGRDGHFTFFGTAGGLPAGAIVDILRDQSGRLWFASARSGLIRVDDPEADHPHFISIGTSQGLSSNRTSVLADDAFGRIYVGTGRGLDRVDPATGRIRHFTTADGLASGTFLCAYRDQSGAIWLGMTGGLSRLVPSPDPPAAPPPVFINSLVVGTTGEPVSAIGSDRVALGEVASDDNRLQIDFVGLSFAPGESLRYEYQLEGADHGWNPPSDHRSVNYANLAPGRYRFLVRARTADGVASAVPAEVTFVILRPWWQRWWFIGTVFMVMAAVAQWGYRTRMARLVELANVRARIALDLHDDIGSNLTKIAILSEVARQQQPGADTPDGPLSSIARISRESVAAMSDIVWAINPHRDRLLDLVRRMRKHAEEVLSSRGVKVSFNAPADNLDVKLGVDVRRDLFLIFKEAINNVARHAVPTRVDIVLQADRPMLRLLITDDGRGFDPGLRVEGDGLVSMRHRAQRLGGSLDVRSAAGLGTTIEARLPMRATRRHNDPHEHVGNRDPEPR